MSSAPFDLSISAARADALFASALQRSDEPSARQVPQAIAAAIGVFGDLGYAARVAQAYGEHPETAVTRMRWARTAVAGAFGGSQPEPARRQAWPVHRALHLPCRVSHTARVSHHNRNGFAPRARAGRDGTARHPPSGAVHPAAAGRPGHPLLAARDPALTPCPPNG
jgi:hypothetical protein